MLLRLNVMLLCRGFTEMKELPNLPPELSQIAVLVRRKVTTCIVSRHKVFLRGQFFVSAAQQRCRYTVRSIDGLGNLTSALS